MVKWIGILLLMVTGGIVFLAAWPMLSAAQDTNQVALVVREGDTSIQTACVEFTEPQINGLDVLARSGLNITLDAQGMGALVCSINNTGCPANDCLCQCSGGGDDCIYWSYWHQESGAWDYSLAGASLFQVSDGAIEGWSWGPGASTDAIPPPDLTFSDVCSPAVTDTPTIEPTDTATPVLINTPCGANCGSTPVPASSTPTKTATATFSATPTAVSTTPLSPTPTPINNLTTATSPPAIEPTALPQTPTIVAMPVPGGGVATQQPTAPILVQPSPVEETAVFPSVDVLSEPEAVEEAQSAVTPENLELETAVTGAATQVVAAAATTPVRVIGADAPPPTAPVEAEQPAEASSASAEQAPSWPSYAVFILIIVGLGLLLWYLPYLGKNP